MTDVHKKFQEAIININDKNYDNTLNELASLRKDYASLKERNDVLTDDYRELRYACSVVLKHISKEV